MQRQNLACQEQVKVISDTLLVDILKSGLVVSALKRHGKSNAVKIIVRELLRRGFCEVKVFDSSLNWLFDFDSLQYQLVGEATETENKPNMIYDATLLDDTEDINRFIQNIVAVDFHNLARMKLLSEGTNQNWICYVIEEAQNIIGSSALRGKQNRFWLKAISTGRNLNGQSFIFITQRLSDVSSKAVERCEGYLIGKLLGDNDLRKLRAIAGKELSWLVKDLAVGNFYYYNGQRTKLSFPLFNGSKAEEYILTEEPQKTLWQRFKEGLGYKQQ